MHCQRESFSLPDDLIYLNCCYKAPQLKVAYEAGIKSLERENNPSLITPEDFFTDVHSIKKEFAKLIDCVDHNRIALIPSVSYGISTITNNLKLQAGQKIILTQDQFPSNVYPWLSLAKRDAARVEFIAAPKSIGDIYAEWNQNILDAIDQNTAIVALGHIHWTNGAIFDLQAIREKTRRHDASLIIDGSQSIGALPFSIRHLQPDALICAGYKWLLSPYSISLGYFGPGFDQGLPLEEYWINKEGSEDFSGLVNYTDQFRPLANRYSMGEQSNLILAPMMLQAIKKLNDWSPQQIQDYCKKITKPTFDQFIDLGLMPKSTCQASHLSAIKLSSVRDLDGLKAELANRNIITSIRGSFMRIAPHLYNTEDDLQQLQNCLTKFM